MSLYKNLVNNISEALIFSLNEMAKASERTIDKKLWLSVASTCSRNRSTDAEFIKPIGNDKDLLLLRYVAALIIMRKPCPETEEEIDSLKTYKLVAKKAISLGATLKDILNLYELNASDINKRLRALKLQQQQTTLLDEKPIEQEEPETTLSSSNTGGLFDDDMFDDDFYDDTRSRVADKLLGMDKDASLEAICVKLLDVSKPRGWKYVQHTSDEYDKFVIEDRYKYAPGRTYWVKKYVRDFIKNMASKNWQFYYAPDPFTESFRFETLSREDVQELAKTVIDNGHIDIERLNLRIEDTMTLYDKYLKDRAAFIKNINDSKVKSMFNDNPLLYVVGLSPDKGLILTITRPQLEYDHYTGIYGPVKEYIYTFTFTGDVNYNSSVDDKKANKEAIAQAKLNKKKIDKFYKFVTKYCGLKNFRWKGLIDDDGYPFMVNPCDKKEAMNTYSNFTKYYRRSGYLYIKDENQEYPNSFFEVVQNPDAYRTRTYVKLVGGIDSYHQYSSNFECYELIALTPNGKASFDNF